MKKPVYQIRVSEENSSGGYFHKHVQFRPSLVEHTGSLAQLCVNNRMGYMDGNGYRGVETAKRMLGEYEGLMREGYHYLAERGYSSDNAITLSYQLYARGEPGKPDQWCRVRYNVGDEPAQILWCADLIRRIRKEERNIETPENAIAALADMFPCYLVRLIPAPGSDRSLGLGHLVIERDLSVRPAHVRALKAARDDSWNDGQRRIREAIAKEEAREAEKLASETETATVH